MISYEWLANKNLNLRMKNKFLFLFFIFFGTKITAQTPASFIIQTDKPIANVAATMWGIFFEDINLGADGGIYAELIKNRSFEFTKPLMGWTRMRSKSTANINPLYDFIQSNFFVINRQEKNTANPRFLRVAVNNKANDSLGLQNEGFRGMGIKKGVQYNFSVLYKLSAKNIKLHLELVSEKGETIGTGVFVPIQSGDKWQKGEANFTATATDNKAKFNIWFEGGGIIDLDMISLFPSDTWKGRKGGMRNDMIQLLADMKPGFIRFPGGCIVEGNNLAQRYQWKNTIGKIEDRQLIINRWNQEIALRPTPDYFQTFGLGFYEYFQLAEDIGAAPLPILNCGMACQFNTGEIVPIDQLDPYVQDALDLIEFANGSINSKWGSVRAKLGHPNSFNLKMLGVGNENWGPQYIERLTLFQKVIKSKYPAIKLICSSGVFEGESFNYLNTTLRKMKADFIDEHYYSNPKWFLENATRYDRYSRSGITKVFAGEYAAQSDRVVSIDNKNNWRTAIAEAAFMTGLERNADVVEMASYAPLFAHVDGWQWTPNLIWVDNLRSYGTANYQVQKMFSTNKGTEVLSILYKDNLPATGQDSLYASATIDKSTNELIIKMVNTIGQNQTIVINLSGNKIPESKATILVLQSDNVSAENSLDNPFTIVPTEKFIDITDKSITTTLLPYSFSVMKIKLK
jgi:alpha-L-arabinofuranosidase